MSASITQQCANVPDVQTQRALQPVLTEIADRARSVSMTNAGWGIVSAGAEIAKVATAWYGFANGVPVRMTGTYALTTAQVSGLNVATATTNFLGIHMDSASTVTCNLGTPGATLAAARPPVVEGKATLGYIVITAGTTVAFTGGTTALDATNTGMAYGFISPQGMNDPFLTT